MSEKGFRKGMKQKVLDKVKESLTKEELQRIQQQRDFDSIEKGTFTYDLALHLDDLRKFLRQCQITITKQLWNVLNANNQQLRYEDQLKSGQIYEKLKDDVLMNEHELKSSIIQCKWLALGEVRAIADGLAKIRGVVGHFDLTKEVIINDAEYMKYVDDVRAQLENLGYDIFD